MHFPIRTALSSPRRLMTAFLLVVAAPSCGAPPDGDGAPGAAAEISTAAALTVAPDAAATSGADAPDSEFMDTPVGRFHQSCVHAVGEGAEIDGVERVKMRGKAAPVQFAPCRVRPRDDRRGKSRSSAAAARAGGALPAADGWAEWDGAPTTTNAYGYNWINELDGFWKVPLAPRQSAGQTVFLFTAAEPLAVNAIIQPVLQYGPSAAGGGNYWAQAVWYISSTNNVYHSSLQRVNVGDTIEGYMSGYNCSPSGVCSWQLTAKDGTNLISTMFVTTGETFRYAFKGVLEFYRVSNCNKLPVEGNTGATFTNVHVYMPGPNPYDRNEVTTSLNWAGSVRAAGCSFGVIDTRDGTELYWN